MTGRPPDVLFVTIDQWRADSLSCAGHPTARTPNLDRVAARGVRFANHFAQTAPCGPSRASLLTGTYAHVHRSVGNGTPLDDRFTNLAYEMTAVGYEPTLFGYTDTTVDVRAVEDPSDPRLFTYEGVLPGFTTGVWLPEHLEAWGEWLRSKGYDAPAGEVRDAMYRRRDDVAGIDDHGSTWAPTVYDAEHSEAAFLTERFLDWVRARPPDEPWFAHLTYIRPHPPHMAPAPWHDLIDPAAVPMPTRHPDLGTEAAQHPIVAGALASGLVTAPADEAEMRQVRATYWGMLAEVDYQFGRILDHLGATGAEDRTLVVVTADHGDQLGDHWLMEKLGYFRESYHVPLLVAGPAVAPGARATTVDAFTESIDVMPTILDLVGREPPTQCQGGVLRAFLEGRMPRRWRDAVHSEWDFRSVGSTAMEEALGLSMAQCNLTVRRDAHGTYVVSPGLPPAYYDRTTDPHELHNRAAEPAMADRMLDAAHQLLQWRLATDDETLTGTLVTPFGPISRRDPPRWG